MSPVGACGVNACCHCLQKVAFYDVKGGILPCKRMPLTAQYATFCFSCVFQHAVRSLQGFLPHCVNGAPVNVALDYFHGFTNMLQGACVLKK